MLRERVWIPVGAFALAVLLSVLSGPTQRALARRLQSDMTGHDDQCTLTCGGGATPAKVVYKNTSLVFPTNPLFKTEEQISADYVPTLTYNLGQMQAAANCAPHRSTRAVKQAFVNPGSLQTISEGPTFFTYARGTAQISGPPSPTIIQTGNLVIKVKPLPGVEVESIKLPEGEAPGTFTTTLEAKGPEEKQVTSYACVDTLAVGDSEIMDEISERDAASIKILLTLIKTILKTLTLFEGLGEGAETADKILEALIHLGLNMRTSASYRLSVQLCPGKSGKGNVTTSTLTIHNEEGERIGERQVIKGDPFQVSLDCEGNPIALTLTSNSSAEALAAGVRGDAASVIGDLWGYAAMMCCSFNGNVQADISFMRDAASFKISEQHVTRGLFKKLQRYEDLRGAYAMEFDDETKQAFRAIKRLKCPKAKTILKDMHLNLSDLVHAAE